MVSIRAAVTNIPAHWAVGKDLILSPCPCRFLGDNHSNWVKNETHCSFDLYFLGGQGC